MDGWRRRRLRSSCHTYPNDKLLQQSGAIYGGVKYRVVIPIQTISFYNEAPFTKVTYDSVVIPIQTISFYNLTMAWKRVEIKVVIPIQTISFYNCATFVATETVMLSYLSKR